jgi:hypothetical protein
MNLRQFPRPKTRFRPIVERLEERCVPAVTPKTLGTTLTLTGDNGNNTILVNDNGANSGSNITGSLDGVAFTSPSFVDKIVINTKGGKDNVTYKLNGGLLNGFRSLNVSLGADDDKFAGNFAGSLDNVSIFTGNVQGNAGNDKINYNAAGISVGSGSLLNLNADGGQGQDTIGLNFSGSLVDALNFQLNGGANQDKITANVNVLANSGGSIGGNSPAAVNGNAGDDQLDFRIHLGANSSTSVFARLDGGTGPDTCFHTANVVASSCKVDNLVP